MVIGFFDTLYWSREFRRKINSRKSARMTAIPQFSVPEIYVDDQDEPDIDSTNGSDLDDGTSPMLSPTSPRSPTARQRTVSTTSGYSPQGSSFADPTVHRRGPSRSGSPSQSDRTTMGPALTPPGGHSRSGSSYFASGIGQSSGGGDSPRGDDHQRQESAVSVQDVMQSLDNSAWGESIRRSFSTRRPGSRR